jgi:hypothetical protein
VGKTQSINVFDIAFAISLYSFIPAFSESSELIYLTHFLDYLFLCSAYLHARVIAYVYLRHMPTQELLKSFFLTVILTVYPGALFSNF